jgi:hypothetical protein
MPERDRTAVRERSRLHRLDMTGTDERRNSRSRSGTPTRGDNPVPQPNFVGLAGFGRGFVPPPAQAGLPPPNGEDPFRMNVAAEQHVINLNDDIPPMQMPQNAQPLAVPNFQGVAGPLSQEGVQMQWQLPQLPAQVVAGARRNVGHAARQAHPQFPDKIWCTKGRHWVLITAFGPLQTCASCRAAKRARDALAREQRLAQEAQAAAQLQLAAQIGAIPQPPPEMQQNPLPPMNAPPLDPLSAISPDDKILLNNCRERLMNITMESCNLCHEEWFDLGVEDGICKNCRKSSKFQPSNNMYPGNDASHLPELTQMEEMLISPVHALVQLWQIRGGQTKYTGHTCNFPRENAIFHAKVPLLPEECDIIIMRRTGAEVGTDATIYQDFRVRRHAIQQWLEFLVEHHPTFRSHQVAVDYAQLDNLPVDGLVHDRL